MSAEELHSLAENALNIAVASIQNDLGVEYGDFAGTYFTGEKGERFDDAVEMLEDYIKAEQRFRES